MRKKYGWFFGLLILLTPFGLIAEGTAWGEWGTEELAGVAGFLPPGIEKGASWWQAILPDYSFPQLAAGGMNAGVGYLLSALIGSAVVYLFTLLFSRMLAKSGRRT